MSRPDLSVSVRLTPHQAVAILSALDAWEDEERENRTWQSRFAGARTRVRNAFMDAGWEQTRHVYRGRPRWFWTKVR